MAMLPKRSWSAPGRSPGITYTNTLSHPIHVSIFGYPVAGGWAYLYVNGNFIAADSGSAFVMTSLAAEVPPGGTYLLTCNCGAYVITSWKELR